VTACIKKITECSVSSKEISPEVNAEETRYMFMPYKQGTVQHSVQIADKSYDNMAKFKYEKTTR
jgi:hypothetical protein